MLRILAILVFLVAGSIPAAAGELQVPDSYKACQKDAPYTTKTEQKCVFEVPLDRTNNQTTKDYFACQKSKPNWQFLQKFSCDFADWDDLNRPRFARCVREKKYPSNFPRFDDDCRLLFYNPDYTFPNSLETCMKKEDHKEDVTLELKQICAIKVSYVPETTGEPFDKVSANIMIERCQAAGGEAHTVGFRPECRIVFRETEAKKEKSK